MVFIESSFLAFIEIPFVNKINNGKMLLDSTMVLNILSKL